MGNIFGQLGHAFFLLPGLGVHIALPGEAYIVVSQLAFNGLFIQRRIIHKRGNGVTAPPVEGMEINPAAAVRYRPVNALIEALDSLMGDGNIRFFSRSQNLPSGF